MYKLLEFGAWVAPAKLPLPKSYTMKYLLQWKGQVLCSMFEMLPQKACCTKQNLLKDLGIHGLALDNVEEGMRTLSRGLRSVKVLIVLDDVDDVEQLDALMPTKDNLKKGSLIIVTTRTYDVLKSWGISCVNKMKRLDPLHAQQLFCWHAFLKSCPPDEFKELVKKFLEVCNGLPLSLKVFGAQLHGESRKEYWESQLHKISRTLSNDIKQTLKISYDSLDDEEKEMFLDVACFFIGEESSLVIDFWNGLGWSGLRNWERLLHKCLVELDNWDCITMHDHLRDLGRDIANEQSPYRLWNPQQIINVQKQNERRIGIQGIKTTSNQFFGIKHRKGAGKCLPLMLPKETAELDEFGVRCSKEKLMVNTNRGIWSLASSSVGLKYLRITVELTSRVSVCKKQILPPKLSRELVWLRLSGCTGPPKPFSGLSLKNLRVLEVAGHHLIELWGESDGEGPMHLRQLLISNCHKIQRFPKSIGHLKHLKKIVITFCPNVDSLPDEFCLLQSLEHLVFRECRRLSSLPNNFGNLSNLRHLCLSDCTELRRLPLSFKNLILLQHLNLQGCSQLTFTLEEDLNFLENITKLEYLNLSSCKQLEELPLHITNQASLRELYFWNTSLRKLPEDIGQLSRLRQMKIHSVPLTSLPSSLGDFSSLTNLSISDCPELKCLPDSLGHLSLLTNLSISDCPRLECLPDSIGDLSSLTNLSISDCRQLERELKCLPNSLGHLSSLTKLSIHRCSELKCLPNSLGDLSSLTSLSIEGCTKLEREGVKSLPKSIRQLNNLQWLAILQCPISELDFGLSNLKEIRLYRTEVSRLSFSEDCCPHLESLRVYYNHHLEEIKALPRTLKTIGLGYCEMLKSIPSFAEFNCLTEFHLEECCGIEKIEGLGNCTSLQELFVKTCWEVPGIESLEDMQNLKRLQLKANKGPVIESCIQRMQVKIDCIRKNLLLFSSDFALTECCESNFQKWPDQFMVICARAIPNAASLVHSLLSPNLVILNSIPSRIIKSVVDLELMTRPSGGGVFMFCIVINCVSSEMTLNGELSERYNGKVFTVKVEKGRWALLGYLKSGEKFRIICYNKKGAEEVNKVEKALVVRGGEQISVETVHSLLSLLLKS